MCTVRTHICLKLFQVSFILFYFLKDETEKRKKENHPTPSSNALSQDPAFLLTFLIPTLPKTDCFEDQMYQATWHVYPNILLSDPHQFSGDCMFIKHQDSKSLLCIPTLLMSQAWKGHSLGRNSVT